MEEEPVVQGKVDAVQVGWMGGDGGRFRGAAEPQGRVALTDVGGGLPVMVRRVGSGGLDGVRNEAVSLFANLGAGGREGSECRWSSKGGWANQDHENVWV